MSSDVPFVDWYEHRVSYGETDAMQVLYYAEYFHIFERARSQYIRHRGVSYKEIEARGIFLPVREANCRYRLSARYEDLLHVKTWISQWGRASVTFNYEVFDPAHQWRYASATTQHAFVNSEGKPVPIPQWFLEIFKA